MIKIDRYYLSDLIYALTTLSAIQQTDGDFSRSIETTDEALHYLEQNNGNLRQTDPTVYFTVSITRLHSLIALAQYDIALDDINNLIHSARKSSSRKRKFLAELLFMRAMLLLDFEREDEALQDATESCDIYRTFADKALRYQFEFASCLNELCFLQSSDYPEKALVTIEESLQIYEEGNISFSPEILADHVTALLHHTGLLIESGQNERAFFSIKKAVVCQKTQIDSLDYYDEDDPFELISKLQQSEVLLGILDDQLATGELHQQIKSLDKELESKISRELV